MSFGSGPKQSGRAVAATEDDGLIVGERTVPGPQTQGTGERRRKREDFRMCREGKMKD